MLLAVRSLFALTLLLRCHFYSVKQIVGGVGFGREGKCIYVKYYNGIKVKHPMLNHEVASILYQEYRS